MFKPAAIILPVKDLTQRLEFSSGKYLTGRGLPAQKRLKSPRDNRPHAVPSNDTSSRETIASSRRNGQSMSLSTLSLPTCLCISADVLCRRSNRRVIAMKMFVRIIYGLHAITGRTYALAVILVDRS